jgi:hypothetical protein
VTKAALSLALAALAALAGCGTNPKDPGTSAQALAEHEAQLSVRAEAAARNSERLVLQELLSEARLGQEAIEQTVPFGQPGRDAALSGSKEVVRAIELLLADAPALAQPHLDAATRLLGAPS